MCTGRGGKGRETFVAVWPSTRGEASNGTHERSSGSLPLRERETVALIMQIETKGVEEHTRICSTDIACDVCTCARPDNYC